MSSTKLAVKQQGRRKTLAVFVNLRYNDRSTCTIVQLALGRTMDIVIDTSAIIAVIANEPERDALIELTKGADLIAPLSVHWEIGNALSALLRRDRATFPVAIQAIETYQQIPIRFVDVELDESIRIAHAQGISAYDAYLIRCARKYRSPLVSLDRYLVECAVRAGVQVLEVNQ